MADFFDRLLAKAAGSAGGPSGPARDGTVTSGGATGNGTPSIVVAQPRTPARFESGFGSGVELRPGLSVWPLEEDDERTAAGAVRNVAPGVAWPEAPGGPPSACDRPASAPGPVPVPGRPLPLRAPERTGGPAVDAAVALEGSATATGITRERERSPEAFGQARGDATPAAPARGDVPGQAAPVTGAPAVPRGRRPTARPPAAPPSPPGTAAAPKVRSRRQPPPVEQVVTVRIGRIEVTTRRPPPVAQPAPTTRRPPKLSLERFLDRDRSGAGEVSS